MHVTQNGNVSQSFSADFRPILREKKRRKNHFHVCQAVHESEYQRVERPTDTRTNEPIKPAHRFEVTLEPDSFTEEKCVMSNFRTDEYLIRRYTGTSYLSTTSVRSTTSLHRRVVSSASFALASSEASSSEMGRRGKLAPTTNVTG